MNRTIPCPQCKKQAVYSTENKFRPFCSERCALLDLGDWAAEKFAIPIADGEIPDPVETEEEDDDGTLRQ